MTSMTVTVFHWTLAVECEMSERETASAVLVGIARTGVTLNFGASDSLLSSSSSDGCDNSAMPYKVREAAVEASLGTKRRGQEITDRTHGTEPCGTTAQKRQRPHCSSMSSRSRKEKAVQRGGPYARESTSQGRAREERNCDRRREERRRNDAEEGAQPVRRRSAGSKGHK